MKLTTDCNNEMHAGSSLTTIDHNIVFMCGRQQTHAITVTCLFLHCFATNANILTLPNNQLNSAENIRLLAVSVYFCPSLQYFDAMHVTAICREGLTEMQQCRHLHNIQLNCTHINLFNSTCLALSRLLFLILFPLTGIVDFVALCLPCVKFYNNDSNSSSTPSCYLVVAVYLKRRKTRLCTYQTFEIAVNVYCW